MCRDATSSWSGYIFQGEVALCKTIEKINELNEIQEDYCLRLEEDEDFSIQIESREIFQVKAYTAHNYTKYKKAWNDMMNRFGETPSNNYLYIQSGGIQIAKFTGVINSQFLTSNIISGEYRLDNINQKLHDAVREFLNDENLIEDDIDLKVKYCCQILSDLIKERHRTNIARTISFSEIIDWINNKAPISFNENVFWFSLEKLFFQALIEMLEDLEPVEQAWVDEYNELQNSISELENLSSAEFKLLIKENTCLHKEISKSNLRGDLVGFFNKNGIQNIIGKAMSKIKTKPDYKKLIYQVRINENIIRYQLTTNNDSFDVDQRGDLKRLKKQCEIINKSRTSNEIDYYVTEHLSVSKPEMRTKLINVVDIENVGDINVVDISDDGNFGLKKIVEMINEINE